MSPIAFTHPPSPTNIYTPSLHDALPILSEQRTREARELFASTKAHGTGFGVPLAVKVIESEHRGRLRFDSNDGAGTRRRPRCSDRKSTRLNSSHLGISYAVFCLKKKKDI